MNEAAKKEDAFAKDTEDLKKAAAKAAREAAAAAKAAEDLTPASEGSVRRDYRGDAGIVKDAVKGKKR
jgi:predicted HAD superfamily Cof-like phosphohydrolase